MSDITTKPTEGIEGYLSWATHLQNGVREYIDHAGVLLRGWENRVHEFMASDVGKALSMAAIAYAESHGVPEEKIDNIDHVIHNAITLAIAEMPEEAESNGDGAVDPSPPVNSPPGVNENDPFPPPPAPPTEPSNAA